MKKSTLFAIILGLIAVFGAFIFEGGRIDSVFMLPPMIIVFGGTLAAGLAGSSWKIMKRLPRLLGIAFNPPEYDEKKLINQIVEMATIVRLKGVLALEGRMNSAELPFMKKLINIVIDGGDSDIVKEVAATEVAYMSERHYTNIKLFMKLGGYAPTMGIIGTVMGLISTLASAGGDPNDLIHHIASAFIATMWGIVSANFIWLPIGDKLKQIHEEEIMILQLMVNGFNSVVSGELPSVIKARLVGTLPSKEQYAILDVNKAHYVSPKMNPKPVAGNKRKGDVDGPFSGRD